MDDDMYPHDGEVFNITEPEDQVKDRAEEQTLLSSPKLLIENLIERMDAKIVFYKGAEAYPQWALQDKDGHWSQTLANRQTIENLLIEKEYLQTLLTQY